MSAPPEAAPTAAIALSWAADELRAAGCETPLHDAALLLADALGVPPRRVTEDLPATPAALAALRDNVRRRRRRVPLGYVRGRVAFRDLELAVDPRVFIPRPETELLVEAALALPHGARVLEPCTGSGAVALALKHERPDLSVTGTDCSADAIGVARANAARLGLDVAFARADGILAAPGGPYDAVVSNPPYVGECEAGTGSLPPELERHEPPEAFWAGDDGLALYRRLAGELDGVATVAFEIGDGQAEPVCALLSRAGLRCTRRLHAPSGQVRVVVAQR